MSPEAETRSYAPPPPLFIKAIIWVDEPTSRRLILQPVSRSNPLAKLLSEYAGHSSRSSAPSPLPAVGDRAPSFAPTHRPGAKSTAIVPARSRSEATCRRRIVLARSTGTDEILRGGRRELRDDLLAVHGQRLFLPLGHQVD